MRKSVLLIIIIFFLSGCVQSNAPEYLLKLMPGCTGFAVDHNHYMTAAHCADSGKSATTLYGQVLKSRLILIDKSTDIALVQTNEIIKIDKFAEFESHIYPVGAYYGACPKYILTTGRAVAVAGHSDSVLEYRSMRVFYDLYKLVGMYNQFGQQNILCSGDSGGVWIVNGKVSGMGIIIDGFNLNSEAMYIYVIPSERLINVLEIYRTPSDGNR